MEVVTTIRAPGVPKARPHPRDLVRALAVQRANTLPPTAATAHNARRASLRMGEATMRHARSAWMASILSLEQAHVLTALVVSMQPLVRSRVQTARLGTI